MNSPETLPNLNSLKQTASKIGASVSTTRRFIDRKLLGAYRIGKKIMISDEQIKVFLQAAERPAM